MTPFQQWVTSLYDHLTEKGVVSKQTEFGDLAGVKQGSVSRWLSKTKPMTPDLESVEAANAVAAKYGFPAYFNEGTPEPDKAVLKVWYLIPEDMQDQALSVLKTFARPKADQPPPPAPQPPPVAPSNRVTPRFKEQPELPTIGRGGTVRYYLLDWMDHRNMEPEDLVKRLPDWELEDLKRVLAGRFEPPDDLIYYAAKALRTSEEKLQEMPPAPAPKPAKKDGKKAAKR